MKPAAEHGGAFFSAIGEDFSHLDRSRDIIPADVLDAWFDPAPGVIETLHAYLPFLARTAPPVQADGLVAAIAAARSLPPDSLLVGPGSSALLFTCLPRLVQPGATVLRLDPMYGEYEHLCESVLESQVVQCRLRPEGGFQVHGEELSSLCRDLEPDAVFLVNPNSPTGRHWPRAEVLAWLDSLPASTLVLIDETYIDFAAPDQSLESEAARRSNLLVLKSMSKAYALSGLRAGYLVAAPAVIDFLSVYQPPWNVGFFGQVAAVEALRSTSYYTACWTETRDLRDEMPGLLAGIRVYPSEANFYLIELESPARVAAALRDSGIYLRECQSMGPVLADRFLRVAVRSRGENQRIAAALTRLV
jgi:histidinol-phosphate/aromatic aminotransferase/cobyric acid decarboxylase-like protein